MSHSTFLYTLFMTQSLPTDISLQEIITQYEKYGDGESAVIFRAYEYAKNAHK